MAVRVTALEVKAIMDDCEVADSTINTMITAANAMLNKVFAGDSTLGTDLLKEIERWYSAHLVASTLHRYTQEEKIGDAQIRYAAKLGEGFNSTPYGQMVLQLDTTGKLANVGKRGASIYAIPSFE